MKLCTLQIYSYIYVYKVRKTFERVNNCIKRSTIDTRCNNSSTKSLFGDFFNCSPRNHPFAVVYSCPLVFDGQKLKINAN